MLRQENHVGVSGELTVHPREYDRAALTVDHPRDATGPLRHGTASNIRLEQRELLNIITVRLHQVRGDRHRSTRQPR
jgi:hypothetical protein